MSILGNKDSNKLETVRHLEAQDQVFWAVLKRPMEDIAQRTNDLDRIFTPARGTRVRQTTTPSSSIEVEIGYYINTDGVTISQSNSGSVQTIAIPAASAGQIRIDLIYFNLSTGLAVRTAGAEIAAGGGFGSAVAPNLPAGLTGAVPLAFLNVDETPTSFAEVITTNVAGRIVDARTIIGGSKPLFSAVAPLSDTTGGSVGSSPAVPRSDHRHALNVDAVNPANLGPSVSASPGSAAIYARRDHTHAVNTETVAGNLQKDGTAAVGISGNVVRADHVHPSNVDGVLPVALPASGAGSAGSSLVYARRDHVHPTSLNVSGSAPAVVDPDDGAGTAGVASTYARSDHRHEVEGVLQASQNGGLVGIMMWGEVRGSDGAIQKAGSGGWSSVQNSTGNYTITFSPALPSAPIFVGTAFGTPTNRYVIAVLTIVGSVVTVTVQNSGGVVNADFGFIAISV